VVVAAGDASDTAGVIAMVAESGAIVPGSAMFSYVTADDVATVTPAVGQRDTYVQIDGSNLRGGGDNVIDVALVDVGAANVSESEFVIQIQTNYGTAGANGEVVLTADSDAIVTFSST